MSSNIFSIIQKFRQEMKKNNLNAYILPSSDPHLSEYPAEHWKARRWISGFNGSFGTVIITLDKGALFTDSRYFLQAQNQLEGSGIQLVKMGIPNAPSFSNWLIGNLKEGDCVGIDPWTYSAMDADKLSLDIAKGNLSLIPINIVSQTWEDRPALPTDPLFVLPIQFAGRSFQEKKEDLCSAMEKEKCNCLLLSALDEIAWTFNIRGNDVIYNPVVISYAILKKEESILFINPKKVTKEGFEYFDQENIILADYNKIEDYLQKLPHSTSLLLDKSKTNYALYNAIPKECRIVDKVSPANHLKSIKNETEIQGYKDAMISDGIALTQFYIWLEKNIDKEVITEYTIGEKLKDFRSKQPYFAGEGFGTITGYNDHGSVIHYIPTPENAYKIHKKGILLIDSGGQYFNGTTDITRTIALSEPTQQQKKDFTLVLKGNIGLATAVFPQNTRGCQIDLLARKAMWENGINYLHGTGHGVGHFLNVHEGPQSIRMEENPIVLEPGMVMSDEPGIYRDGEYGVRVENMIMISEKETTQFGKFYQFNTLTKFPIDKKLILKEMLTTDELKWLNNYHKSVYEALSPKLNEEEKLWLKEKTSAL